MGNAAQPHAAASRGSIVACLVGLVGLGQWLLAAQPQQAPVNRNRAINPIIQQVLPFQTPDAKEDNFTSGVKLPTDPRAKRKLEMARQFIKTQDWTQAIKLLQSLLDAKEDVFLPDEGKSRRVSVRTEATRLLGSLPKEGLQFYEQEYGVPARLLLKQGEATGDPQVFADVALRYLHTEAGAEAAGLLGAYHLDRGQYINAALCYERLAQRAGGLANLPPLTLFQAALAFERAGDPTNRDKAWSLFETKREQPGEPPLPAGLRRMKLDELRASLKPRTTGLAVARSANWPMYLGSPDRVAQGIGSVPYLEPRLGYPLDATKSLLDKSGTPEAVKSQIEQAARKQVAMNWPLLSGSHPLAVGDLLVYRGAWGIHAVNVKTGEVKWESRSTVGLAAMASPRHGLQDNSQVATWLSFYREQFPWLFFDNTMIGTLSTDQTLVYGIEDLAVPPPQEYQFNRFPNQPMQRGGGELAKWFSHNKLVAYDLNEQGIVWELGTTDDASPFADTFFLGAPLPLGDKLYTLAETNGEIKLLCLQNQRTWVAETGRTKFTPELVWSQPLCIALEKLAEKPLRRTWAVQLAYSDGILVCPTHNGVVIGVDLLTRTLVWAHAYQVQENQDVGMEGMAVLPPQLRVQQRWNAMGAMPNGLGSATFNKPIWGVSAPMIAGGVVVFTAPDAKFIHALSLKDGMELWRQPLDNKPKTADLYVAGIVDGKVLIVGQSATRALDLKSGKRLWSLATGLPNGRGVASEGIYYLPIRAGDAKNLEGGEVWGIDIATGTLASRSRSKLEAPANLIFHDGELISQSINKVVVYPQLSAKEAEITARLKENPNDPSGLAQRGEMRLYRGDLPAAASDLRAALAGDALAGGERRRAEEKLFEALAELVEKDFPAHEADLPDLRRLVTIAPLPDEKEETRQQRDAEQLERKARYLRLLARGRQEQGDLESALAAYLEFSALGGQLITSPEDATLLIAPLVWAQGRVEAMMKAASAEQRQRIAISFDKEWRHLREKPELEAVRRFAQFYAPICEQGRDARLLLVELLLKERRFEEAGIWLEQAIHDADPQRAARALDANVRYFTLVGELENAAHYSKLLAQRFPQVIVRDGKTGSQLYLELSTDKRFLPFLTLGDQSKRGMLGQVFDHIELLEPRQSSNNLGSTAQVWLEAAGPVPPLFQRHRVGIDMNRRQVRIIDRGSDAERRTFPLQSMALAYSSMVRPAGEYQVVGQILVFGWGNFIYAYDLVGGKLLWSQDLLAGYEPPGGSSYGGYSQFQIVPEKNGRFVLLNALTNTREWIGTLGPADGHGICFTQRDRGLVMVDALTGKERWVKTDVPMSAELFGDGEQVYLVPPKSERKNRPPVALRTLDGVAVAGPPFADEWDKRIRQVGRHLLLKDRDENLVRLRLFDPATGKDVWNLSLGKGGIAFNSLDTRAVGGMSADGEVTVVDLATGKPWLRTKLDPPIDGEIPEIHLLADADRWYLLANQPVQKPKEAGTPYLTRAPQQYGFQELRMVDVHGPVWAFDRATGAKAWQARLPVQAVVVEQFEELPMILCASMLQKRVANERVSGNYRQFSSALALDKRDGKPVAPAAERDNNPFVDLRIDVAAGQVEMTGLNQKLIFQLVTEAAK